MSNKLILLVVGIFVLLVVGMFGFAYLQKQETVPPVVVTPPVQTDTKDPYNITQIDGKHFYRNGVHTIVGEIPMPTPCDLLTTDARIAESMPEQILVSFSVLNNSTDCAQVETVQRFKVSATSSSQASITAEFMGKPVKLNLIEAAAGETPEEYELYIKG